MSQRLNDCLADHQAIAALFPRLDEARIWFRMPSPISAALRPKGGFTSVDRDRVFAALTSKAAGTHRAIRVLVDADCVEDALALSRVLLETCVVVCWIRKDEEARIDAYLAYLSIHQQRMAEVVDESYGGGSPLATSVRSAANQSLPLALLLGGNHIRWARRHDPATGRFAALSAYDMFEEVFKQPGHARPLMYDLAYFKESVYIHSSMPSLLNLLDRDSNCFSFTNGRSATDKAEAVGMANLCMALVLNEYQGYLKWDVFEPDLEAIAKGISARSQAPDLFPVT